MTTNALVRTLALFASSFALLGTASADDTANMTVSADVAASCTISAGDLAFGTYDTITGAAVHSTTTLAVACSVDGVARIITLGEGATPNLSSLPAVPDRQMSAGGADVLAYHLYSAAADTTVWGNTVGSGKSYTALTSAEANLTVFGTIDAGQDVATGNYSDIVVATITF